jgi:hypothetical protein
MLIALPLTVSCWINPTSNNVSYQMPVSIGGSTWAYELTMMAGGIMKFDCWMNGATYAAPTSVSAGVWTHVCGVVTRNGYNRIYVNGVLANSIATPDYPLAPTSGGAITNIRIGQSQGNNGTQYNGYLDDVRVYTTAFSASDIAALYYSSLPKAYALYQQPIEGQAIADLAWGTSNAAPAMVSAWIKNNSAAAQQMTLAVNNAGTGAIIQLTFDGSNPADNLYTLTGPSLIGAPAYSTSSKVGSHALDLTANTINTSSPSVALQYGCAQLSLPITASFWIYPTAMPSTYAVPVYFGTTASNGFSYQFVLLTSSIYADCMIGGTNYGAPSYSGISANSWYHVCSTVSLNGHHTLYVNGIQVTKSSATPSSGSLGSTTILELGGQPYTINNNAYKGFIDEVKIYNKVLTPAQILQLYQNNASSTTPSQYLLPRSVLYTTPSIPANAWSKVAFTVPGDTAGTWAKDNTTGLTLALCLGAGSAYATSNVAAASNNSAAVWNTGTYYTSASNQIYAASSNNFMANPANTILVTGVQLEKGSAVTPFSALPSQTQLTQAQRYFEKSYSQTDAVGAPSTLNGAPAWSIATSSARPIHGVSFKTPKRAANPTITVYNPTSGAVNSARNVDAATNGAVTIEGAGDSAFAVSWNSGNSGQTQGNTITAHYTADAEL